MRDAVHTRSLDGLRFLLAFWVVVGHLYIITGGTSVFQIPVLSAFLLSPVNAVDGFMIVTGFLMCYNYFLREAKEPFTRRSTAIAFIVRRFFRLFPVYVVALLAAYVLVTQMYDLRREILLYFTGDTKTIWGTESISELPSLSGLISHLTFTHGLIPGHELSILSVAWSLSLEMQFYMLFPLLFVFLYVKGGPSRIVPFVVVSLLLSIVTLRLLPAPVPAMLLYKLPLFLLGMLIASAAMRKSSWISYFAAHLLVIPFQDKWTVLLIFVINLFLLLERLKGHLPDMLYSTIWRVRELLSGRAAKVGADLSYALYLVHMITMPFIIWYIVGIGFSKGTTWLISLAAIVAVNVILAWVLYHSIEKRFIQYGKKMVDWMIKRIDSEPTANASTATNLDEFPPYSRSDVSR
jgi:peptidoglycan/LPS O-acetylase OafA/YrhL